MKASEPQGETVRPILTNDKDTKETDNREHVNSGGAAIAQTMGYRQGSQKMGKKDKRAKALDVGSSQPLQKLTSMRERTSHSGNGANTVCMGKHKTKPIDLTMEKSMGYRKLSSTICI